MKKKLTPWFPANILPVRDGIYKCNRLEAGDLRVTRMLHWTCKNGNGQWTYTDDGIPMRSRPGDRALMFEEDGDKWCGIQGDEHSCKIGASTYLVVFDEGPDRPGDDE